MKRLPLLLLALMGILFFLTLDRPEAWAGWLHAFAEAGMVGAFADWFAVVALFRHPLGIPVPHTAIIPRRKNEIGDNLARFVADHFLHPDVVRTRLEAANLASNAAKWLKSPAGQDRMVDLALRVTRWMLVALNEERVRLFIGRVGNRQLAGIKLAPLLGHTLDWLVRDGRHEEVLTQALQFALVVVHDNRETVRGNVQRENPWWIPNFVDDRIVVRMLDRIEGLLLQMSLDPGHAVRGDFNRWILHWADDLQRDPEYLRWGEQIKQNMLDDGDLQEYFYRLWKDLADSLEADLEDPASQLRLQLGELLSSLARELENDEEMQAWVNRWLVDSAISLVDENRHSIASLISDTVRSWDAVDTGQRIEQAIGRDLQFIRVNGTLVGGLVGLAIHALKIM